MGKITQAYADATGRLHATPEGATIADLWAISGNQMIGKTILDNREAIESIFRAHDEMLNPVPDQSSAPTLPLEKALGRSLT